MAARHRSTFSTLAREIPYPPVEGIAGGSSNSQYRIALPNTTLRYTLFPVPVISSAVHISLALALVSLSEPDDAPGAMAKGVQKPRPTKYYMWRSESLVG